MRHIKASQKELPQSRIAEIRNQQIGMLCDPILSCWFDGSLTAAT
jgi:hypothetical protein